MRLPKSVLAALAGVSLVFVSACASPDDQTAENTNTQETETAEPETGDTEDGNAETDDAESGSTNEPLASKDVSYNGEDLTVDVLSVRDDGSLTRSMCGLPTMGIQSSKSRISFTTVTTAFQEPTRTIPFSTSLPAVFI